MKYADNGNVLEMPGMGLMGYDNAAKPYQVTAFTPIGNNVPTREQQITYNSFQCPDKITENGYSASFSYDAEGDRAEMTIRKGNDKVLTRQYIDARYEIDNSFTERFYLGGDAYDALAVCVNDFGVDSTYYILRDYLGNITHIINEDGTLRQELSYDAWGRLRNPDTHQLYAVGKEPKLLLDRGYTGHEYLPWFGLINMNARLYDPVLGRFLSPDPYVQMPDFTQNFNRYSYCLNNPLKYVDKDGKILWFIPVIAAVQLVQAQGFGQLQEFQQQVVQQLVPITVLLPKQAQTLKGLIILVGQSLGVAPLLEEFQVLQEAVLAIGLLILLYSSII